MTGLLEIADLHQCGPKFERRPDDTYGIIHDADKIVLKKIRFKAIEGLFEIGGKES